MPAQRGADPLERRRVVRNGVEREWKAAAPSRAMMTSSSCFESVSEYSDPFCTPIDSARSAIEVPWYPRSANSRVATSTSSSRLVAMWTMLPIVR